MLIPTLLSRVQEIRIGGEISLKQEAQEFLAMPLKQKLEFIKKFDDEENNLSAFLDSLLLVLKEEGSLSLERVFKVRKFSSDRSVSQRLILEHLALVL